MKRNTIDDVLQRLIVCESGCIEWSGNRNTQGRGSVKMGGVNYQVHRVVYEHFREAIPKGLELDHLCRNPICANPWHLEAVTHKENILRGMSPSAKAARQITCKRGHPFDRHGANGQRVCSICHRETNRRHDIRRRLINEDTPVSK